MHTPVDIVGGENLLWSSPPLHLRALQPAPTFVMLEYLRLPGPGLNILDRCTCGVAHTLLLDRCRGEQPLNSLSIMLGCSQDFCDAWITAGFSFLPVYQLVYSIVILWAYPVPERPNPSFSYSLYLTAACNWSGIGRHL